MHLCFFSFSPHPHTRTKPPPQNLSAKTHFPFHFPAKTLQPLFVFLAIKVEILPHIFLYTYKLCCSWWDSCICVFYLFFLLVLVKTDVSFWFFCHLGVLIFSSLSVGHFPIIYVGNMLCLLMGFVLFILFKLFLWKINVFFIIYYYYFLCLCYLDFLLKHFLFFINGFYFIDVLVVWNWESCYVFVFCFVLWSLHLLICFVNAISDENTHTHLEVQRLLFFSLWGWIICFFILCYFDVFVVCYREK